MSVVSLTFLMSGLDFRIGDRSQNFSKGDQTIQTRGREPSVSGPDSVR